MIKLDFHWLLSQAKNIKTKNKLKEFKKFFKRLKDKSRLVELKQKQKFPLSLGKYKIWLNDNNVFQSLHTYLEIFKENDHTKLKKFQKNENKVIVDIGANEGHYILKMKENLPNLKIVAIEPNPEAFRILRRNIEENKVKNVITINKAISDINKKVNFKIVKGITQIGGFKLIGTENWIDKKKIQKIIINSITLEKLFKLLNIPIIDILKIDAEGAEINILGGSRSYLRNIKKIVVEYHNESLRKSLIRFLNKNGFKLLLDEKVRFGDLYFINIKSSL